MADDTKSIDLMAAVVASCRLARGISVARTADQWWAWAEEDYERTTYVPPGAESWVEAMCRARDNRRCAAWIAGVSDDGPDRKWIDEAIAAAKDDEVECARLLTEGAVK